MTAFVHRSSIIPISNRATPEPAHTWLPCRRRSHRRGRHACVPLPPSGQQQRFPESVATPSPLSSLPPSFSPLHLSSPSSCMDAVHPPPSPSSPSLFSTFHTLDFFVPLFGFSHRCRSDAGRTDAEPRHRFLLYNTCVASPPSHGMAGLKCALARLSPNL